MIEIAATTVSGSENGEWARKIAELYMNWYTFFVTANILLLGWFYRKEAKDHKPPKPVGYIFLMLNVIGAITSNLVGYFLSHEAGKFGVLMIWAGATNSVGLLGIAFLWVHTVRIKYPKPK
jgi:prolipoprotein diacylglyceryltransferase